MNIESIKLFEMSVTPIWFLLIFAFFIFVFTYYFLQKNNLKRFVIFDITFIGSITAIVIARFFGIINSLEYYFSLEWRILPIIDSVERVTVVKSMPWELFNIFDGNFVIIGFIWGIIISSFFIYLNSNKQKTSIPFIESNLIAFLPSYFIILISSLYTNFYSYSVSFFDYKIHIIIIEIALFIFLLFISFIIYIKTKKFGIITLAIMFYTTITLFFIYPKVEQINKTYQIQWYFVLAVITLLPVIIIITRLNNNKVAKNKIQNSSSNLVNQEIFSDINIAQQQTYLKKMFSTFGWKKKK